MKATISFRALALALFIFISVSYLLCIAGDLLFGWNTLQSLAPFIPGFTWPLSFTGFLIGLLWIVVCSLYSAAWIAYPYNYFLKRESS